MSFHNQLPTDETLILYKLDSILYGNTRKIKANVQENMIVSFDTFVNVEEDDILERILPNGFKEYFLIKNLGFHHGGRGFPDSYRIKYTKITKSEVGRLFRAKKEEMDKLLMSTEAEWDQLLNKSKKQEKTIKLFISHSSKNKDYVKAFVELLEDIGLRKNIICSSISDYSIPLNKNIYDWLRSEFQNSNLHVIYLLSKEYYNSVPCLNEMGATWALKHKWTSILLPKFDFSQIEGCIDKNQISIKLDDTNKDLLNLRLEELKKDIIEEFKLSELNSSYWERKRNEFLNKVTEISKSKNMQ